MLRRKVANPRTILAKRGNGETFSLPNSETTNARMAATVVADMASASVTSTLSKTPGIRLALGSAGGRKSSVINSQNASLLANSVIGLKSVSTVQTANSTTHRIRKPVYSFLRSRAISGIFRVIQLPSNHQVLA